MCDQWMPGIELAITREQLVQLPRNAAYRYEFLHGMAHLSPRPKHYHALLDLRGRRARNGGRERVSCRRLRAGDLPGLEPVFADAFRDIQPFGSLDEPRRLLAARQAIERTRTGGDGPWIEQASFVAECENEAIGAILVTLLPPGDPRDFDSYRWRQPPPDDCIRRRLGRPHLTWIFVSRQLAGRGIGTLLLDHAVRQLRTLGYRELLSTFLLGNDSSMLWHWRNGFTLLAYPGSLRSL